MKCGAVNGTKGYARVAWVNSMLHLLLALLSNRTLVTLEMGTNELTDATAEKLGLALKANNKLEGLSLWQNDITAEVILSEKAFNTQTHMHTRTNTHTVHLSSPRVGSILLKGYR